MENIPEPLIQNLDNPHLNYVQFLMRIDDRHGIKTVPEAERQVVERLLAQKQEIGKTLGGLTVEISDS